MKEIKKKKKTMDMFNKNNRQTENEQKHPEQDKKADNKK